MLEKRLVNGQHLEDKFEEGKSKNTSTGSWGGNRILQKEA